MEIWTEKLLDMIYKLAFHQAGKEHFALYFQLNSSVCDEVIRVEEKLARVKEERR